MPLRFAPLPDQAYLLVCLDYNPDTGELRWRKRPRDHFVSDRDWKWWNARFSGTAAGTVDKKGRTYGVRLILGTRTLLAHRLIWKMITGDDPSGIVDHINRQDRDNRWVNLRAATGSQNNHNTGLRSNNLAGLKGVTFHQYNQKFVARVCVDNKSIYLGIYTTKEEAHRAYCVAAKHYFGDYWCAG